MIKTVWFLFWPSQRHIHGSVLGVPQKFFFFLNAFFFKKIDQKNYTLRLWPRNCMSPFLLKEKKSVKILNSKCVFGFG